MQSSEQLDTQMQMAPASLRRATAAASDAARTPIRDTSPDVLGMPWTAKASLAEKGTPSSGGSGKLSPRKNAAWSRRLSACFASSSAASNLSSTAAFRTGLTWRMRAMYAPRRSTERIVLSRRSSAWRTAERPSSPSESPSRADVPMARTSDPSDPASGKIRLIGGSSARGSQIVALAAARATSRHNSIAQCHSASAQLNGAQAMARGKAKRVRM
mmetsp:Transcript_34315/g.81477  ORF Transcript_34315/g.81477 Transcript_34315/m.81477 type:complete len:215 (+) Transcript_34315:313-957(+)